MKRMIGYYDFDYSFAGGILNCKIDYEPPERGSWQDGVQVEPDVPASVVLYEAYVDDIDIMDLLSEGTILDIEDAALREI